jgi:hypothetical protein
MAQAAVAASNGSHALDGPESTQPVAPGKRKRDSTDEGDDVDGVDGDKASALVEGSAPPTRDQRELVKTCFKVLTRYVHYLTVPRAALFLHPFPLSD